MPCPALALRSRACLRIDGREVDHEPRSRRAACATPRCPNTPHALRRHRARTGRRPRNAQPPHAATPHRRAGRRPAAPAAPARGSSTTSATPCRASRSAIACPSRPSPMKPTGPRSGGVTVLRQRGRAAHACDLGAQFLYQPLARVVRKLVGRGLHLLAHALDLGRRDLVDLQPGGLDHIERLRLGVARDLALIRLGLVGGVDQDLALGLRQLVPRLLAGDDDQRVVGVSRDRQELLRLVQLRADDRRERVVLPVDGAVLERRVELGERQRQRVGAERLHHVE